MPARPQGVVEQERTAEPADEVEEEEGSGAFSDIYSRKRLPTCSAETSFGFYREAVASHSRG